MSYTAVDLTLPGGDTLTAAFGKVNNGFADSIREVVMGAVPGWNYSREGADPTAPTAEVWTNGTLILRIEYSYSSGLVASALYRYSLNSGGAYTNKGTLTYTYDGSDYLVSTAWS
jgi:hypothetical protein